MLDSWKKLLLSSGKHEPARRRSRLAPRDEAEASPETTSLTTSSPARTRPTNKPRFGEPGASGKSNQHQTSPAPPLVQALERSVDIGLALTLFVAPLFMGGRHPLGAFILITIIGLTSVAWLASRCFNPNAGWNRSPAQWLFLGAIGLVSLQLMPLPRFLLGLLSPKIAENLPLWNLASDAPVHLGAWNRISLTPIDTKHGLLMLLAYGLLFLTVLHRIRKVEDVERLLRWFALAACGMAVIGLFHFFFGIQNFFGIYEHPSRIASNVVKGSFANQNHFAHFLALGIGPLIWWLQSVAKQAPRPTGWAGQGQATLSSGAKPLLIAGLVLVALAGLQTMSRGGAVVIFAATALCVLGYTRLGLMGRNAILALGAGGLLVAIALTIHGSTRLMTRLETLAPDESLSERTDREPIWNAVIKAIPDYVVAGAGIGSHREVYPQHMAENSGGEYTHAESGYLQLLLEAGLPGLLLMLAGISLVLTACWQTIRTSQSTRLAECAVAVGAGLVVSVVHSLADFVWYIPACMSLTVILAACACRLQQLSMTGEAGANEWIVPRTGWIGGCAVAGLVSLVMITSWWAPARAAGHWEAYSKLADQAVRAAGKASQADAAEFPYDTLLGKLEATLQANPQDARAHLRMAALCLRMFEDLQRDSANAMTLTQIRDAAVASQFPSRESLDRWLSAAIGSNRECLDRAWWHTRRGLELCPLQGEGYIFLAELSFLAGEGAETKPAYVNQALRLRPHDNSVLFAAGSELILAGDTDTAMQMWKRAFRNDRQSQSRLIEMLSPMAPAEFFLDNFEPDMNASFRLFHHFRGLQRREDAETVGRYFVQQVAAQAEVQPKTEGSLWAQARDVYGYLGDPDQQRECALRAVQEEPNHLRFRRDYAELLFQQGHFADAVPEFQWCASRAPGDAALQKRLAAAHKALRDGTSRAAQAEPATRR